jgi:two-component system, NarL family, sensor kinase
VNNVIKYAGTQSMVITICLNSNSIITTINGDGSGFDKHQSTKGIGLKDMENRVDLVNGKMVIETAWGEVHPGWDTCYGALTNIIE